MPGASRAGHTGGRARPGRGQPDGSLRTAPTPPAPPPPGPAPSRPLPARVPAPASRGLATLTSPRGPKRCSNPGFSGRSARRFRSVPAPDRSEPDQIAHGARPVPILSASARPAPPPFLLGLRPPPPSSRAPPRPAASRPPARQRVREHAHAQRARMRTLPSAGQAERREPLGQTLPWRSQPSPAFEPLLFVCFWKDSQSPCGTVGGRRPRSATRPPSSNPQEIGQPRLSVVTATTSRARAL